MKHFVTLEDVSPGELTRILAVARRVKAGRSKGPRPLSGTTVALLFEKPSLRTRVTFEVAITELGGNPIYLGPQEVGLGKRESVPDIARNLSRWVHAIVARTFKHETVVALAGNARVPVVNALTDLEHPCQAVGDVMTILERKGHLKGTRLAFVGDGGNNVCHALLLAAAKTGLSMRVANPKGYLPSDDVIAIVRAVQGETCASIEMGDNPEWAVEGADAVYTDVWVSMGFEKEEEARRKAFRSFQVNSALMSRAKRDAIFLHCLPAHRGEEVTDEVMDGPHSAVLDQSENRLHSAKAVLLSVMAPPAFKKLAGTRHPKGKRRK